MENYALIFWVFTYLLKLKINLQPISLTVAIYSSSFIRIRILRSRDTHKAMRRDNFNSICFGYWSLLSSGVKIAIVVWRVETAQFSNSVLSNCLEHQQTERDFIYLLLNFRNFSRKNKLYAFKRSEWMNYIHTYESMNQMKESESMFHWFSSIATLHVLGIYILLNLSTKYTHNTLRTNSRTQN